MKDAPLFDRGCEVVVPITKDPKAWVRALLEDGHEEFQASLRRLRALAGPGPVDQSFPLGEEFQRPALRLVRSAERPIPNRQAG